MVVAATSRESARRSRLLGSIDLPPHLVVLVLLGVLIPRGQKRTKLAAVARAGLAVGDMARLFPADGAELFRELSWRLSQCWLPHKAPRSTEVGTGAGLGPSARSVSSGLLMQILYGWLSYFVQSYFTKCPSNHKVAATAPGPLTTGSPFSSAAVFPPAARVARGQVAPVPAWRPTRSSGSCTWR